MRMLLFLFSLLLIAACAEEKKERYASSSAEIDSVKALVKAYEEGDWGRWMTFYADTAKVYHNSTSAVSPKELGEGMQGTLQPLQSYGFQEKEKFYEMIVDDNDEVWVNFWANWEGTLTEPDTSIIIPVHLTAQFNDGRIVEEHAYYNMAPYAALMESRQQADSLP